MAESNPRQLIVRIPTSREAVSRAIAKRYGGVIEPLVLPPKKSQIQTIFELLNVLEREFVAKVLALDNVGQLSATEFENFMNMHVGVREVRMKLQVAECWREKNWKEAIPEARECIRSISEKCGFVPASTEGMRMAVAIEPTQTQSNLLDQFFMWPMCPHVPFTPTFDSIIDSSSCEMSAKLEAFDAWLRADNALLTQHWNNAYPSLDAMRACGRRFNLDLELTQDDQRILAWISQMVRVDIRSDKPSVLNAFNHVNQALNVLHQLWFNTPVNERFNYWKHNVLDLHTAAGLAHKVRFNRGHGLTREEKGFAEILVTSEDVRELYDRNARGLGLRLSSRYATNGANLPDVHLTNLRSAFTSAAHSYMYKQPIVHLAAFDGQMRSEGLLAAAYVQAQFNVFIDALGFADQSPRTQITYEHSTMRAKRDKAGNPEKCEDNFSSANVRLQDRSIIHLHAVFDGMGGHEGGEIASGIAKEVFEISAMAGWITSPEDVRRTVVMADLAITMEQILRKQASDRQHGWPSDIRRQDKPMGSTMSVAFQHNDKFYGIHCGDSDWRVVRNGQVVFKDVGHSLAYTFGYDSALNELSTSGRNLDSLTPLEMHAFFTRVAEETDKQETNPIVIAQRNVIVSAVGGMAGYITINNMDSDLSPFILKDGDYIVLNSDGIGVPVCDHEFALFLARYRGDLSKVREKLITTAEARRADNRNGPIDADGHPTAIREFKPICGCPPRPGKRDDDKVVTAVRIELPASTN